MKTLGIGGPVGHDSSFCVLEEGVPILHVEKERHTRIKMDKGYSSTLALEHRAYEGVDYLARTAGTAEKRHFDKEPDIQTLRAKIGNCYSVWHHTSHAANAFFSSSYDDALIFTMDGGGGQGEGDQTSSFTVWIGHNTKIHPIKIYEMGEIDLGGLWRSVTEKIFGLSVGTPGGNQSGTVMAMAAYGTPGSHEFSVGKPAPKELPFSPSLLEAGDKEKFDIAASLQKFTEDFLKRIMTKYMKEHPSPNICLAGGVALNSVATGKMLDWFPGCGIYVPPVPYDGGLSIGSAQYLHHHVQGYRRVEWASHCPMYLGYEYLREDVEACLASS